MIESSAESDSGAKKPELKSNRLQTYLMLHGILFLYSVGAVCSKMASGYAFFSWGYLGWYAGLLVTLGVYALVWQQVLRRLPLITAFANKGITIVWGMLWGMLLFDEAISLQMIVGAALVFCGILLVVSNNGE